MSFNTCQQCGKQFRAGNKTARFCTVGCYRAMAKEYSKQVRASWSPQRRAAIIATGRAIETGALVRQPCEVCGKSGRRKVDAHHDDYSKPLQVRWLCRSHHSLHHARHGRALNA